MGYTVFFPIVLLHGYFKIAAVPSNTGEGPRENDRLKE
jgi:hypothetical protein